MIGTLKLDAQRVINETLDSGESLSPADIEAPRIELALSRLDEV